MEARSKTIKDLDSATLIEQVLARPQESEEEKKELLRRALGGEWEAEDFCRKHLQFKPKDEAPQAAPREDEPEEWIDTKAVAAALGLTPSRVAQLVALGCPSRIERTGTQKRHYFRLSEVRAWRKLRVGARRPGPKSKSAEAEPVRSEAPLNGSGPAPWAVSRTDERADLLRRHGELALALQALPEVHVLEERERVLTGELARVKTQLVNVLEAQVALKRVELKLAALGAMGGSA